jgi:uncharacterized membrane protein
MLYIIKSCVKCIYYLQKYNYNQILCKPNIDPKKNNDIESCDDVSSEEDVKMIENNSFTIYNFIHHVCCELYEYILKLVIILIYIFIFYIIYEVYHS